MIHIFSIIEHPLKKASSEIKAKKINQFITKEKIRRMLSEKSNNKALRN